MVAELLLHPKRRFHPPENNWGIHFSFTTKIPGDTLLTNLPAELLSAEQIFTETSRLVPLFSSNYEVVSKFIIHSTLDETIEDWILWW